MKTTLQVLSLFTVMALVTPFTLQARTVSIEQVKQNIQNLKKPIKDGQPTISAKKFKDVMGSDQKFILLDVRSESEFKAAHLPGALHVERGRIEWIIPNIIKNTETKIYVYCRTGERSSFAAARLYEMGYANVVDIIDGFRGWLNSGYPVYNLHGEFFITPGGFEKKEPTIGNMKQLPAETQ